MWIEIKNTDLSLELKSFDILHWQIISSKDVVKATFKTKADKIIGADLFNIFFQVLPEFKEFPPNRALASWLRLILKTEQVTKERKLSVTNKEKSILYATKLFEKLNSQDSLMKLLVDAANNRFSMDAIHNNLDITDDQKQTSDKIFNQIDDSLVETVTEGTENEQKLISSAVTEIGQEISSLAELNELLTDIENVSSASRGFDLNSQDDRLLDLMADELIMYQFRHQGNFSKMMAELGRMKLLAAGIKSNRPSKSPVPVGVIMGNNLHDLLPQEISLLDDDVADLFMTKYYNNNLLQYDKKSKQIEGFGPIIMLIDYSGSMNNVMPQVKAFGMEMVRNAVHNNRSICYIPFATNAPKSIDISSRKNLLEFIGGQQISGLGYGTDFNNAFEAALKELTKSKYKNADIIMLSDGYSYIGNKIVQEIEHTKTQWGYKLMGVLFNGYWPDEMKLLMDAALEVKTDGTLEWQQELLNQII